MKRPSCVHRHRLYRKETTAAWTTRPRTDSMKSVKNKRAAASDTATTLPDGITIHIHPQARHHSVRARRI